MNCYLWIMGYEKVRKIVFICKEMLVEVIDISFFLVW